MIKQVYFCRFENLEKHLDAKGVIAGRSNLMACINIGPDPNRICSAYFKPILNLDFSTYDPLKELGIHVEERKRQTHHSRFNALRQRHPDLPTDKDCERIIIFINELFKDDAEWTIWICCPDGRRSSASIARFIEALGLSATPAYVVGLDAISTDWQNLYLSGILAYNYGLLFSQSLKRAAADESHADSQPTTGGKKG